MIRAMPKFIIWDGMDRTGKSSTLQKVWKARGKIDMCMDRGILSNIVYNIYFKRVVSNAKYLGMLKDNKNTVYIYLYARPATIKNRAVKTNDDIYSLEEIIEQKKLFDENFKILKECYKQIKFISIDTGKYNQEEVVKQILEKLK